MPKSPVNAISYYVSVTENSEGGKRNMEIVESFLKESLL